MSIGEKIRQLRLQHAMTLEELSKLIGVSTNQISKWENNKVQPSARNLKKLSALFKVDVKQFTKLYKE